MFGIIHHQRPFALYSHDNYQRTYPFDRGRVRHDHGVDPAVADQARRLLNVLADEIQQDDRFRCLFLLI